MNLISTMYATRYSKLIKNRRLRNKWRKKFERRYDLSQKKGNLYRRRIKRQSNRKEILIKLEKRRKREIASIKTMFKQKSLKSKGINSRKRSCKSDIGQKREGIIWNAVGKNPFRWKISVEGIIKMDRL